MPSAAELTTSPACTHAPVGAEGIGSTMRKLLPLLLLSLACVVANAAPPVAMQPVVNAHFDELAPDGKSFLGWSFGVSHNAAITLAVDPTGGHGGSPAPLIHDASPLEPNVYGRLRQTVKVLPAMGYRLTCWCKAVKAAGGNHWTDWKTYSLGLPGGTYDWTRVETTLTTAADQHELDLGLNVVDVTDKLWVDDVTLEPDMSQSQAGDVWLGFWSTASLNTDKDELSYRVWCTGAPAGAKLQVEVVAATQRIGQAVATADQVQPDGLSGTLKLSPSPAGEGTVKVSLVDASGKALVTAERPVQLVSALRLRIFLDLARQQATALTAAMRDWERRGLPVAYPRVTATVSENFLPWIGEDINRGDLTLASQELSELHEALGRALDQCASPPPVAALTVPRYTGGPIAIEGGHFSSQVRWPDGRTEQRPLFFIGYGHFGAVRRDVEKFPSYGLNIIQVEFGPSSVVKPDLTCDTAVVTDFLKLLDRCQKAGVAVNLLLSPHYFPQWAYEKWPELGGVDGGFIRFDIDAPQARQVEEAFLRGVIPMLKGHPALHSLCLSNEPIYLSAPKSPYNLRLWHDWLAARHGDIGRLNALYGTKYASFDEVPIHAANVLTPSPELYDWVTFNNQRFANWHRWMADIIHSMAPEIPVHAKIMNLPFNRGTLTWGNDVEEFCDLSQIAGNDCSNNYEQSESSPYANQWRGESQYYDLLRSMRGQPVFNSENHIVSDRDWRPVPPMHMRNLVWEGALHGLGASTTWVWERSTDPKSDFAGSIMYRPGLCDAHGRTALDLMRLAPEMVALQDSPARVAIVYSIASAVWNSNHLGDIGAAYEALTRCGEKVDFLTWRQLAARLGAPGEGSRYQAIVLAGVTNLEPEGLEGLKKFAAQQGKQLIATTSGCLAADEYSRPRELAGLPLTVLQATDNADLTGELRATLKFDWPVQVTVQSAQPAPVVGWRWAHDGGRWLVDVCNYGRQPVQVQVACPQAQRLTNLFTMQPVTGAITLQPMEPVLIEAR